MEIIKQCKTCGCDVKVYADTQSLLDQAIDLDVYCLNINCKPNDIQTQSDEPILLS